MATASSPDLRASAGADSVPAFRERARVGVQSAAGYEEGKALPVSW